MKKSIRDEKRLLILMTLTGASVILRSLARWRQEKMLNMSFHEGYDAGYLDAIAGYPYCGDDVDLCREYGAYSCVDHSKHKCTCGDCVNKI